VPQQYVDGKKAPIIVVHDGPGYVYHVRTTLDNLIADGRLPTIVAIFVNHGGGDSIGSERGLEYDTMSDKYARFIEGEVLPAVLVQEDIAAAYPNLAFTENPEGRAAMGCSSGGAAALTMGWFRPDLFRRIFTYSGTFVDQQHPDAPTEEEFPRGAWEYHAGLIENSPVKPLRIFIQASEWDLGADSPESSLHNWVLANERTAEDLKNKGYHYRYIFSRESYHCDGRVRDQTLPETMLWLWRGYPID
jgi:enterochelin esterase family protein